MCACVWSAVCSWCVCDVRMRCVCGGVYVCGVWVVCLWHVCLYGGVWCVCVSVVCVCGGVCVWLCVCGVRVVPLCMWHVCVMCVGCVCGVWGNACLCVECGRCVYV